MKILLLLSMFFVHIEALDCTLPGNVRDVFEQQARFYEEGENSISLMISLRNGPFYVCQVQGTTNGTYQQLSVILEYTVNNITDKVGQFEVICVNTGDSSEWESNPGSFTPLNNPPLANYDDNIGLRTNCSSCIETADNDNHCEGKLIDTYYTCTCM